MNREDWKEFGRGLDTASLEELQARHEALNDLILTLRDHEVRANALWMRKEIEGLMLYYRSRD